MATQTGSFDFKSAKEANSDARKYATNYLSADSSGIMIYDGANGVQTPSAPSSTTKNVFIDSDSVDIREGTKVVATFGAGGALIGEESDNRLALDNTGLSQISSDNVCLFNIDTTGAERTVSGNRYKSGSLTKIKYIYTGDNRYSDTLTTFVNELTTGGSLSVRVDSFWLDICSTGSSTGVTLYSNSGFSSASVVNVSGMKRIVAKPSPVEITVGTNKTSTQTALFYITENNVTYKIRVDYKLDYVASQGLYRVQWQVYSTNRAYAFADYPAGRLYRPSEYAYYTFTISAPSYQIGLAASEEIGPFSIAAGESVFATSENQASIGKYNIKDANNAYAFIIGNGTSDSARSNALAVTWDGDIEIQVTSSEALGAAITALGWDDLL